MNEGLRTSQAFCVDTTVDYQKMTEHGLYFEFAPCTVTWFKTNHLYPEREAMYADYAVRFLTLLALVVFGSYWLPKLLVSLLPVPDLKRNTVPSGPS